MRNDIDDTLTVGLAQIAPAWLQREPTLGKIRDWIGVAADGGCALVAFGEALLPGYPFWVERTDGARFESALQKDLFAHYVHEAVDIDRGDLEPLCAVARQRTIAVYVGVIEKCAQRGQSLYCSMVFIDPQGRIGSVHRKLVPTYEERLVWSPGDGHGLRTHTVPPFTVGGLNCWENWLPLARASLYGQGEDLHVAIWPGNVRNTADITRFIAREGRSYVMSVSGLMRATDIAAELPHAGELATNAEGWLADGGSCLAGPDGEWVLEPVLHEETLQIATLSHAAVRRERQNMDPAGHYARPDVTRLILNRERQATVGIETGD